MNAGVPSRGGSYRSNTGGAAIGSTLSSCLFKNFLAIGKRFVPNRSLIGTSQALFSILFLTNSKRLQYSAS